MAITDPTTISGREELRHLLADIEPTLPVSSESPGTEMRRPTTVGGLELRNRLAVLPVAGNDSTLRGVPSAKTLRRWESLGGSGAALLWGEGIAVQDDGRANPRQMIATPQTMDALRKSAVSGYKSRWGSENGFAAGVQLTHSGRWSRDGDQPAPRIAYRHPHLDKRSSVKNKSAVLSDMELEDIGANVVRAARMARDAGFDFVDVKHCHGYLFHELLSARCREGRYGGSIGGRTRFLRQVIAGIRTDVPDITIAVRLSLFDTIPFRPHPRGTKSAVQGLDAAVGVPDTHPAETPYTWGFGVDENDPSMADPTEPHEVVSLLRSIGVNWIGATGGSTYYTPHLNRPYSLPSRPQDYGPPEDPLVGVARHIHAAQHLKARHPEVFCTVGGLSYLGHHFPYVADALLELGWADSVGLGRGLASLDDQWIV